MARRRYVSTDISTDARVNKLSDFAALLYTWMLPHSADDGGISADPQEIRLLVVPGRERRRTADVAEAIAAMLESGLLQQEDHRLFFPPETFYKYQSYVKPENRRKTPQNTGEQRETPQKAASVPVPIPVSVSSSPSVNTPLTPLTGGNRGGKPRAKRSRPSEPGSVRERVLTAFDAKANGAREVVR